MSDVTTILENPMVLKPALNGDLDFLDDNFHDFDDQYFDDYDDREDAQQSTDDYSCVFCGRLLVSCRCEEEIDFDDQYLYMGGYEEPPVEFEDEADLPYTCRMVLKNARRADVMDRVEERRIGQGRSDTHSWKRSNRHKSLKQWMRHPWRVSERHSPRFFQRWYEGDELDFLQSHYEPEKLEDLGHEGVWSPPLPRMFGVVGDWSFDHFGNLNRPRLIPLHEQLTRKECFKRDAYEDPDRDDFEMHVMRTVELESCEE